MVIPGSISEYEYPTREWLWPKLHGWKWREDHDSWKTFIRVYLQCMLVYENPGNPLRQIGTRSNFSSVCYHGCDWPEAAAKLYWSESRDLQGDALQEVEIYGTHVSCIPSCSSNFASRVAYSDCSEYWQPAERNRLLQGPFKIHYNVPVIVEQVDDPVAISWNHTFLTV